MLRSIQQLEALQDEWDALACRFRNPLLDHDWYVSCAEAFHDADDLRVLLAKDAGAIVGIAPLARSETSRGSRLTLLGASRLYEPGDWLFASGHALSELVDQTIRTGEPTLLTRVPVESPLCQVVDAIPARRAFTLSRRSSPSLAV